MKAVKLIAILFLVYAGIVIAFESLIGYSQPERETTLVITCPSPKPVVPEIIGVSSTEVQAPGRFPSLK